MTAAVTRALASLRKLQCTAVLTSCWIIFIKAMLNVNYIKEKWKWHSDTLTRRSHVQRSLHLSTHLAYTESSFTGRQNCWTQRPWQRLNFFLASFFSSNNTELLKADSDEVVGAIVAKVLVGLIRGALLVALLAVFISVSASKLLGRLRFRVREVSESLGFRGACSASALGTAGTGMNWR